MSVFLSVILNFTSRYCTYWGRFHAGTKINSLIYLAQGKFLKERIRLVCLSKLEAWIHFHVCPTVPGGDKGFVRPEVLRVCEKCLEERNAQYYTQNTKIIMPSWLLYKPNTFKFWTWTDNYRFYKTTIHAHPGRHVSTTEKEIVNSSGRYAHVHIYRWRPGWYFSRES